VRPAEIARQYLAAGHKELARGSVAKAVDNFDLALSYSSPRTQHVALLALAQARLAKAKRLSKGARAKDREEALQNIERAIALAARLNIKDDAVETLHKILVEAEELPFKVVV